MNQLPARIYYEIATGNILTITSEDKCLLEETTKEQDILYYPELKDKSGDEIDFIELEYGTLTTIFNSTLKAYSINLEAKTLNTIYYSQSELDEQTATLQAQQSLNDRTSTISEYMNTDTTSITDIESYILQRESNEITGGM